MNSAIVLKRWFLKPARLNRTPTIMFTGIRQCFSLFLFFLQWSHGVIDPGCFKCIELVCILVYFYCTNDMISNTELTYLYLRVCFRHCLIFRRLWLGYVTAVHLTSVHEHHHFSTASSHTSDVSDSITRFKPS